MCLFLSSFEFFFGLSTRYIATNINDVNAATGIDNAHYKESFNKYYDNNNSVYRWMVHHTQFCLRKLLEGQNK